MKLLYTLLVEGTVLQPSHVDLLRQIRLFRNSEEIVVSKEGRTGNMGLLTGDHIGEGEDWTGAQAETVGMQVEK